MTANESQAFKPPRKLAEVFKTVGLPAYTYVKPRYFGEIRSDIEAVGKHLLIEGPSGIGKTCVVYAVFKEIGWRDGIDYSYLACRDSNAIAKIRGFLREAVDGNLSVGILVADDFHILPEDFRHEVGSIMKRLSDKAFSESRPGKLILIGIPAAGSSILTEARDLGPRIGSYRFKSAEDADISRLIDEGEEEMNVIFENRNAILAESSGNFWLAQYICNKICSTSGIFETTAEISIVDFDLSDIRHRLMTELTNNFMGTATTFAKGKKWRPGGNKPYLEIILALCKIPDLVVPFDTILAMAQERRRPGLKAVKARIKEVIYDPIKSVDLRKQIAFEEDYFSLEDPLFRYFLTNLDEAEIYRELGVRKDRVVEDNSFPYEVGFSFAGETRAVVEFVNSSLKQEDSVTFYDYDQQSFLLAEDLEQVLPKIYAESCRYYLVFLDNNYLQKVWTRFEKDIMTRAGRTRHIIPVILEQEIHGLVVGIPSTVGMIDLSDQWARIKSQGGILSDRDKQEIRDKLVLPVVEKVSTSFTEL